VIIGEDENSLFISDNLNNIYQENKLLKAKIEKVKNYIEISYITGWDTILREKLLDVLTGSDTNA